MHYAALINDAEYEVEIHEIDAGRYRLTFADKTIDVDVRNTSESSASLVLDNHAYNIEFENNPEGGENLLLRGNVVHVEVLDLRRNRLRKVQAATGGPAGPATIASPMPGKIVAVLVKEGQEVEEGDGLVVVEAMKMENELRAPRAGVVKGLTAEEGVAVEGGVSLCVVE